MSQPIVEVRDYTINEMISLPIVSGLRPSLLHGSKKISI